MELGELFTRKQAIARGHTDRELTDLVRSGAITRVGRGVYRPGTTNLPDAVGTAKALRSAISKVSAASWYGGALLEPPDRLYVTTSRCRGRRTDEVPGVVIHRADLSEADVISVRGCLVTTPLRTALDLSRSLPIASAVATIDSLCRLGRLRPDELAEAVCQLPNGPGRRQAMQVAALIDDRAESVFESITRVEIALAGFPAPTPQLNIINRHGKWIARVDFAWEAYRLVLECDGYEYHCDREAFERDRQRWTALTRAGWQVVVVTWRDLAESPGYLLEVMADFLPLG